MPRELTQRLTRTRREAEAALYEARDQSRALRGELDQLPAQLREQPAFRQMLARLDELDDVREHTITVLAEHARHFER
jgi:hypothetical protein